MFYNQLYKYVYLFDNDYCHYAIMKIDFSYFRLAPEDVALQVHTVKYSVLFAAPLPPKVSQAEHRTRTSFCIHTNLNASFAR